MTPIARATLPPPESGCRGGSARQKAILAWVVTYTRRHRHAPPAPAIVEAFGITKAHCDNYLSRLVRQGLVVRTNGKVVPVHLAAVRAEARDLSKALFELQAAGVEMPTMVERAALLLVQLAEATVTGGM